VGTVSRVFLNDAKDIQDVKFMQGLRCQVLEGVGLANGRHVHQHSLAVLDNVPLTLFMGAPAMEQRVIGPFVMSTHSPRFVSGRGS
jgi:hypothetical protein